MTDFQLCTKCGEPKVVDEFPPNAKTISGRDSWCRECRRSYMRGWHKRPEVVARQQEPEQIEKRRLSQQRVRLKARYNLTVEDVQAMIDAQGGLCAICRLQPVSLALLTRRDSERSCVEHDHLTNQVRGITCLCCNLMLGYAKDDPAILGRAIDYLKKATQ